MREFAGVLAFIGTATFFFNFFGAWKMVERGEIRTACKLVLFAVCSAGAFFPLTYKEDVYLGPIMVGIFFVFASAIPAIFAFVDYLNTPPEVHRQRKREKVEKEAATVAGVLEFFEQAEDYIHESKKKDIKRRNELDRLRSGGTVDDEKMDEQLNAVQLPESVRTQHGVIVAASGHGKTQLLQSLIYDDMQKEDATLIVIDSQSQLIDKLVQVAPTERLVHLTPSDTNYPLALNLFDEGQDPSLYEYIFSALDSELTAKQATVYRYVSRFVSIIPHSNIDTMRQLLEKGGVAKYAGHLDKLPEIPREFFQKEYESRQYDETKQQILRRLYAVLENETFLRMFTAPEMKLNLEREINNKKVILIDTSKRTLSGDAFKIFGRFFIAQIAKAVFSRADAYPHRVYIYIDEFQEYANEEGFVTELFTQARKQNVALMVAYQFLSQLPDDVNKAILSNTAIKVAGGLSSADHSLMTREFGLQPGTLPRLDKGRFNMHINGKGLERVQAPFGRLENLPRRSTKEMEKVRSKMRRRYSVDPAEMPTAPDTATSNPFAGFDDD